MQHANPQNIAGRTGDVDESVFPTLHVTKTIGDRGEQLLKVQFRGEPDVQIQQQAKTLLFPLQLLAQAFAFADVLDDGDRKLRVAGGAWRQRAIEAYPDRFAVLQRVTLLNLETLALSLPQFIEDEFVRSYIFRFCHIAPC